MDTICTDPIDCGTPTTRRLYPFGAISYHVVVDLPLLRVAVEGSDNPVSLQKPCQAFLPPDQQGATLSGDNQRSSILLEVYRCVQLKRWSVVCGCFT